MDKKIKLKPIQSTQILVGKITDKTLIHNEDKNREYAMLEFSQTRGNDSEQVWNLVMYKKMIESRFNLIEKGDWVYVEVFITPAKPHKQITPPYTKVIMVVNRIDRLIKGGK